MPKTKRAKRGDIPSFPELENEINEWVLDQRQNGYIVTRGSIRFRALQLKKMKNTKINQILPHLKHQQDGVVDL